MSLTGVKKKDRVVSYLKYGRKWSFFTISYFQKHKRVGGLLYHYYCRHLVPLVWDHHCPSFLHSLLKCLKGPSVSLFFAC